MDSVDPFHRRVQAPFLRIWIDPLDINDLAEVELLLAQRQLKPHSEFAQTDDGQPTHAEEKAPSAVVVWTAGRGRLRGVVDEAGTIPAMRQIVTGNTTAGRPLWHYGHFRQGGRFQAV
jgi:hypothetical protein